MRRHFLAKSLRYLVSGLAVLLLNFLLPRLMPGDPIVHLIGVEDYYRYPAMAAQLKARHGLDQPLHRQFLRYVTNLSKGDLGYSFHYRRNVGDIVLRRLLWTLILVLPALVLGAMLAAFLGAWAGWHRGRNWERGLTASLLLGKSLPQYGVAMLVLLVLGYNWQWFPLGGVGASGWDLVHHAALPLAVLVAFNTAEYYLILRNSLAALRRWPFVVAAQARGLSQRRVLFGHALRQALPPFLTLVGLGLGFSVAGALLVEMVLSWPGMGTLLLTAVENRDYPLLQACLLLLTFSVLAANYLTDLLYGLLDPRIRQQG